MEGFGGALFFVVLVFAFSVIGFFVYMAILAIRSSGEEEEKPARGRERGGPAPVRGGAPVARGDLRRRQRGAQRQNADGDDSDGDLPEFHDEEGNFLEGDDDFEDKTSGKIGAKKLRKLEMKEEKRREREFMQQEREEKKKKQEEADRLRRIEEEKEAAEERAKEEAERLEKERKEKEEYEEYLKIKASFAVEEEGCDADFNEEETQNRLQQFIDYIKQQKVVHMDELAGHFNMRTQDVISRVQDLLEQEQIIGVIDDRGKFIYITEEELKSVGKFIRQRGRVSITDLAENSNMFVNLVPVAEQ